MTQWVATSFGCLDLRSNGQIDVEYAIVPTRPAEPVMISGRVAGLWRRLVEGPVDDQFLTPDEAVLVREFAQYGIASADSSVTCRVSHVPTPWLTSPMHELVYALIGNVACASSIRVVFIKGPALHAQGLRDREHSGDVDVWVEPERAGSLAAALASWGWTRRPHLWHGTGLDHSVTLRPPTWGCEIDLHKHFPGIGLSDAQAFDWIASRTYWVSYAGTVSAVPTREAHAVLAALHLVRPRVGAPVPPDRVDEAARTLLVAGAGVGNAIGELQAEAALRPVLARAFPGVKFDESATLPTTWAWRTLPTKPRAYAFALRTIRARHVPRVIFRLVWPPAALLLEWDRRDGGSGTSVAAAHWRRWARGLRSVVAPVRRRLLS
jgi:hypothetical protein